MSRPDRFVEACNFCQRYAVDDDGVIGDIDSFLDRDGDDTDEVNTARFAIVCWRDDKTWSPIDMDDFVREPLH